MALSGNIYFFSISHNQQSCTGCKWSHWFLLSILAFCRVQLRWSSCEGYSSLYHSPTQHTKFQRWNSPERRRKIDVQSKNLMCWSIWSFNIHTPLPLGILTCEDCFVQIPNLIIPFHFPTSAVQGQPSNAKGLPNGDGDVEAPNWLGHKYWNIHFIYPVSVDGEYTLHKTRLNGSMVLYFIY